MNHVLYVGPAYANHRGGIGAVLEVYAKNISPFKFIPTYSNRSFLHRLVVYVKAVFLLIYTLITDRSIKIVHIHSSMKGSFLRKSLLVLISKLFGKKVVLHIHGSEFQLFYQNAGILRGWVRYIFSKADAVISLSKTWTDYFGAHFRIKHLAVVNNVIEKATSLPHQQSLNGHVNLLFLGLIGQRKGIFDLLEVIEKNKEEFSPHLTLTIGGNGDVEKLEKAIAANHPEGNVQYVGWVNGSKKKELLEKCDVYILPSYNEGLPISILEAMANGKPVISTQVGGIPEIVRPGFNGWLFDAGDQKALYRILQEVIDNKQLLGQYGNNSLQLSENYTPAAVMNSLDQLYKKLLNS